MIITSARLEGRWVKMADFPVWVGGLSLDVKENVLHSLFCKFGPIKNIVILKDECGRSKQCGFVNFLSQEAAEVAAKKLDGFQVLGQAIKTKGPLELLSTGRSTTFVPSTAGNLEKKDYRPLTDCPYFAENRECFPKPGEVHKRTSYENELKGVAPTVISMFHLSHCVLWAFTNRNDFFM